MVLLPNFKLIDPNQLNLGSGWSKSVRIKSGFSRDHPISSSRLTTYKCFTNTKNCKLNNIKNKSGFSLDQTNHFKLIKSFFFIYIMQFQNQLTDIHFLTAKHSLYNFQRKNAQKNTHLIKGKCAWLCLQLLLQTLQRKKDKERLIK